MLVIGTSAAVQPAASLPYLARQHGAKLIEINPEKSIQDPDFYLQEKAGTGVPAILQEDNSLIGQSI